MELAFPPAGSGHPTPCTPTPKHRRASCGQQDPFRTALAAPARERLRQELWPWPEPGLLCCQHHSAASHLLLGPAGHSLWSTILLFLVPMTLSRRQAAVLCGMWGHYRGQLCHVLWCDAFPMPDSPWLGKSDKHCAEMHVLSHFKVNSLNETHSNMPGFPWGC